MIFDRSIGVPSTVAAPGLVSELSSASSQEVAVQRRRQVGRVGVPEQDVERRRRLAHQVVGDPVVPDQVVRAQPREHAGERAPAQVALARGLGRRGHRRVGAHERAGGAGVVLVEHRHAEREPGDPVLLALRRQVRDDGGEHDAARAQAHHVRRVGARDRLDGVERLEHRARVGVEVPVGVALGRVAPGDREHLLAVLDRVLHHAAARRQVGDVVLVDHRRREQQRPLAHLRGLRLVLDELEHRRAQHDRARA